MKPPLRQTSVCKRLIRGTVGINTWGRKEGKAGWGKASPKMAMANPVGCSEAEWSFRVVARWGKMASIHLQTPSFSCAHITITVPKQQHADGTHCTSMELKTLGPLKERGDNDNIMILACIYNSHEWLQLGYSRKQAWENTRRFFDWIPW